MPIEFLVKVIQSDKGVKATVTRLIGYVDASTLEEFEQVLRKLIEKGAKNIILDCEGLEYINSTGLGLFLKYTDEIRTENNGKLALIALPQNTLNVVELLGFDSELNIYKDEANALVDMEK